MITEFDSIFHENGFIFVNEMKKDIEAQMAARVEGQRKASKDGHRRKVTKNLFKNIRVHKNFKTGKTDLYSTAIDPNTGKSTHLPKQHHDEVEAERQKNRAERKEKEAKKKEKQAVNASALMESIELI